MEREGGGAGRGTPVRSCLVWWCGLCRCFCVCGWRSWLQTVGTERWAWVEVHASAEGDAKGQEPFVGWS